MEKQMEKAREAILGHSYHYMITTQTVGNLTPGKQVFLKWKRSLTTMGQTSSTTVGPDGVATFEHQLTLEVSLRKAKTTAAGTYKSKPVWFTLKEKVPSERPGVIFSVNPTIAKGSLELANVVDVEAKPVTIDLEITSKTDTVPAASPRPMLTVLVTSKPRDVHED